VLLVAVVILSVVTVGLAGGSLSALGRVRLRYTPAIFGALAVQIAILAVVPGGSPWLHRVLHIGSYALAAVFVVANRRLAGMRMLALGATLNLIAIIANNGVMPASRSALRTAGMLTNSTDFLCSSSATSSPCRTRLRLRTCTASVTSASRSASRSLYTVSPDHASRRAAGQVVSS
jgi:hypothetical protein